MCLWIRALLKDTMTSILFFLPLISSGIQKTSDFSVTSTVSTLWTFRLPVGQFTVDGQNEQWNNFIFDWVTSSLHRQELDLIWVLAWLSCVFVCLFFFFKEGAMHFLRHFESEMDSCVHLYTCQACINKINSTKSDVKFLLWQSEVQIV